MDKDKVLQVFVKAEGNLQALLAELPTATPEAQVNKLASIQQTSYLLERLNRELFHKITQVPATQLKTLRQNCPEIKEIGKISVDPTGIKFTYQGQAQVAPLLNYQQVLNKFKITDSAQSGKFVQMSYLLRPENYLDICLIAFWRDRA
jgi:hypothetical protein